MSTPINRLPLGVLGFLGIKNGGRYPDQPTTNLAWVWSLEDFYLGANSEFVTATINPAALGSVNALTVPAGELWFVSNYGVGSGTLGAGQSLQYALSITDPSNTVSMPLSPVSNLASTGNRASLGALPSFVLPTGWSLAIQVTTIAAGPIACTASARIARMPI